MAVSELKLDMEEIKDYIDKKIEELKEQGYLYREEIIEIKSNPADFIQSINDYTKNFGIINKEIINKELNNRGNR